MTDVKEPTGGTADLGLKFELWRQIATSVSYVALVLASAVPLYFMRDMVLSVAGETTVVDVNVVIEVAFAASLVCNVAQLAKSRSQRSELNRQREVISTLEQGLGVSGES